MTEERTLVEWQEMAHKWHVGSDGTCYPKHHPLCPLCTPRKDPQ